MPFMAKLARNDMVWTNACSLIETSQSFMGEAIMATGVSKPDSVPTREKFSGLIPNPTRELH